jgi:hypothetical protein
MAKSAKLPANSLKLFWRTEKWLLAHGNQQKFCTKMICDMAFSSSFFCHSHKKAVHKYVDEIENRSPFTTLHFLCNLQMCPIS